MDKHPNQLIMQILWKMFYALTSPNYDFRKGIKKVCWKNAHKIFNAVNFNSFFKSYVTLNQLMDDPYSNDSLLKLSRSVYHQKGFTSTSK